MTDYGKPVTPGAALREHVELLAYRAEEHRRQAAQLNVRAAEIDDAIRLLDDAADRYDRYQPTATKSAAEEVSSDAEPTS